MKKHIIIIFIVLFIIFFAAAGIILYSETDIFDSIKPQNQFELVEEENNAE